jgi:acyl CoA:acetate/3-ketoacid CoA transferase beta subunit
MDLMAGAGRVIVAMTHVDTTGRPKIVDKLTLPLTAERPADLVVTERGTFRVTADGLVLEAIADGTSTAWLDEFTGTNFRHASSEVA